MVNSTWQSVQGMKLPLTSSTAQQSTPILNKRDSLKTESVDVLSGLVKAKNARRSSPIVPCVILVFFAHINKCCVYQALAPECYASTMCIFILAYCLHWTAFTNFQNTTRPQALFAWQVCKSSLTSIPPQTDVKNGPCQVTIDSQSPY